MMRTFNSVVACLTLLVGGFSIAARQPSQHPEGQAGAMTRMYSNLRWSAERNALVGANIRLTREGGEIKGSYIVFEGNEQGTHHRFAGTAVDSRITFSFKASGATMKFSGRMTDDELIGKMTVIRPDGSKEEKEFKARRMWRH